MFLKELDLCALTNITTQQIDHITCLECCKYYVAPASAACGHTLCNGCWHGRRKCPTCASPVERKSLQLNLPLQKLTEHIQLLVEAFERLFSVKLDEIALAVSSTGAQEDPNKNVRDWLANSQNHFAAPASSQSTQDVNPPVEYLTTKVQIHSTNVKMKSPSKVTHVSIPQDNWDKISEIEECMDKNQLNVLEPLQTEPFDKDTSAYSTEHPRRSTRNKDLTINENMETNDIQNEKNSTKTSTIVAIKPSKKMKQTWNNVKKMKKEFSKLNKVNRNKLNVSIEMCKKTQMSNNNFKQPDKEKQTAVEEIPIEDDTPDASIEMCKKTQISNNNLKQPDKEKQTPVEEIPFEDDSPDVLQTEKEIDQYPPNKQSTAEITIKKKLEPKATFFMDVNEKPIEKISKSDHSELNYQKSSLTEQNKVESQVDMRDIEKRNTNENIEKAKVKFIKKGALQTNTKDYVQTYDNKDFKATTEDIQISIKIGTTVTNICIKKKDNDLQYKVNTDREIQTSFGLQNILENNVSTIYSNPVNSHNIDINFGENGPVYKSTQTKSQSINKLMPNMVENKLTSTKKSTASADTRTGQFEITESVEKEISDIMECVEIETVDNLRNNKNKKPTESQQLLRSSQKENIPEDVDFVNDVNIFDGEISGAPNVQSLKSAKNLPSRILVPNQINNNKRKLVESVINNDSLNNTKNSPQNKKAKISDKEQNLDFELGNSKAYINSKLSINDSECQNYDLVMDKVFANIDKDIETIPKNVNLSKINNMGRNINTQCEMKKKPEENDQKYSENIFSIMDTDESHLNTKKDTQVLKPELEFLTPNLCQEFRSVHDGEIGTGDAEIMELATPFQENYDSDKSVVEETPQKNVSIPKTKQISSTLFQTDNDTKKEPKPINRNDNKQSVINLTETVSNVSKYTKDNTVIDVKNRPSLNTPSTIDSFFDQIKHKSTPNARKSLNFSRRNENSVDPEQTLCASLIEMSKTTQEREFMNEVFDENAGSTINKRTVQVSSRIRPTKLCVAGSCLTPMESGKLKDFCKQKGWSYADKYTKELTHLVVSVDEGNKSPRSVKYMCALAAGKWIISYEWIEKCIKSQTVLPEEPFEVLDGTGEPGPKRSRLAKKKLFEGITFYCMEPFSVLDILTLMDILEAAGGRVVDDMSEVRVKGDKPVILLAEPEQTQEDKFTYIAMHQGVVPVNYEWIMNCLGCYTLSSIMDLLLCPYSILPPLTNKWPMALIASELD